MNILYISALCSQERIDALYRRTGRDPGFAMQKFNRLVARGLAENGCRVTTLSGAPIRRSDGAFCYGWKGEEEGGVRYRYIPFLNLPGVRQVCLLAWSFAFTLFWGVKGRKNKRVVCDMLNISVCLGAVLASKVNRVKTCGILTDMPGLMVCSSRRSLLGRLITAVNKSYASSFDSYVFLTRQMEPVINPRHRPYIVMEGLADATGAIQSPCPPDERHRSVIYAGGLYEKYGVGLLVDAFLRLGDEGLTLDLYGSGDMVPKILELQKTHPNLHYHGVRPNHEVVEAERLALLLVNPRPTHEEFTKYSFPSKNMEYMLSGTAVLTTRLPGMPEEYHPRVFLFDRGETPEGYAETLREVLALPPAEICRRGASGRSFVLSQKNNRAQAGRILKLLQSEP